MLRCALAMGTPIGRMNIFFAYPWVLAVGLPLVALALWWRIVKFQPVRYRLPITHLFAQTAPARFGWWQFLQLLLRATILLLLVGITARPRSADEHSKVTLEGIATMLVLDVSGSMECFDDVATRKSRFTVAKEEAIRFIGRRPHDLFGIILFGAAAVSRCPLTADTEILTSLLRDTKLGVVNPQGTVLALALAQGVNRLRTSKAKSKIIVVLTDGEPSQEDIDPQIALDLAKKSGVKIYTIGIGSSQGGYVEHPFGGTVQVATPLNENLLRRIAQETGGAFFRAHNQQELGAIYHEIDQLTKTAHEAPYYTHYYEWGVPLLWLVFFLLLIEIGSNYWWWQIL